MTTTYDSDFARPRSRRARIARIDALATLLDTALVIPGTGIRFGLDALMALAAVIGDGTPGEEAQTMTARRVSGAQPFALFCAAGARPARTEAGMTSPV
jgi:hypothetical protein